MNEHPTPWARDPEHEFLICDAKGWNAGSSDDRDRIIACVNACAEWEHPAAGIAKLRATIAKLVFLLEQAHEWMSDQAGTAGLRALMLEEVVKAKPTNDPDPCDECNGEGIIYNNADPACGQYVECDVCKGTGEVQK